MKTTTLLLFLILGFQQIIGQTTKQTTTAKFSLEIDPATFFMKGYGLHIRMQPKNCTHALFGIGAYALDLPEALVDFNDKNKGEDWNIRIQNGFSLFGEHHFTEVNEKWYIGGQLGIQTFKIEKDQIKGSNTFTNTLTMGYVGYTFKPFDNGLYVKPWLGIGYTTKLSGENELEDNTYDIAPITYFATLHIGYTF